MPGLAWFKENIAWDIFDALSPGAVRKRALTPTVISDDNHGANSRVYNFFLFPIYNFLFPVKDHNPGQRYEWPDILIRWFLGESKPALLDLMTKSYQLNDLELDSQKIRDYLTDISRPTYFLRENFFIGHGSDQGKFNVAALFNPFNYFRALDNFLINKGLSLIAEGRDHETKDGYAFKLKSIGCKALGLLPCALGALFRLPRVITQYVVGATVKPLWECYKFNKTYGSHKVKIPELIWVGAFLLTCLNIVLIGLSFGGAAPVTNYVSSELSKFLSKTAAVTLTTQVLNDKLITPITHAINNHITVPSETVPSEMGAYAAAFPDTRDVVAAGLASAPLYTANVLHSYAKGAHMAREEEIREYPCYYGVTNKL
ncbi:MAG TPA: hypothetical protein VI522_06410 [Gammaproteobacteria bacterium]|nr:hypothetical protein [Gammaproteobacteria bacterium]